MKMIDPTISTIELSRLYSSPPINDLPQEAREKALTSAEFLTIEDGKDIIVQGTVGDAFFVLLDGKVEVLKEDQGKTTHLTELAVGAYFGEQALLGKKSGTRGATVRAKGNCKLASISADVFIEVIASHGQNRDRFESDASAYVYTEINKSLNAFVSSELSETSEGIERNLFKSGDILVREGDETDSVYLLISGTAKATKEIDGKIREVSRMGAGQLIGERGVLLGEPRSATVTAENDLEVLKISTQAFLSWHEAHPDISNFFNSLSNVYKLSEGRQMSVFLGEVGGSKAITSVVGGTATGVVSTRVLDQGVVVFTNAKADKMDGERAEIHFSDNRIKRTLRVIVGEKRGEKIERCIVYAVSAEGIDSDLGTLYQHVQHLEEVAAVTLRRFERTGFLGGHAEKSDRLCPCLGLSHNDISEASKELGSDYFILQSNMGVGGICGGCERSVRSFLADQLVSQNLEETEAAKELANETEPKAGVIADVPPDMLNEDEKQLAALLAHGIGPEKETVTREDVAVRLRATGVRDINFFIDLLFPGVFSKYSRATYATLAAAMGRGMGFGPWRKEAIAPVSWKKALLTKTVQRINRMGRLGLASLISIAAITHIVLDSNSALWVWGCLIILISIIWLLMSLSPTGRFLKVFISKGPARFHRALWSAFKNESSLGSLNIIPFGKPIHVIRDEKLVDKILQRPDIYARAPVTDYPAFAEHSVLGGGSSGVWLGYRMLCEEYFSEQYREDLDEMRAIVKERLAMWKNLDQINLLQEVYKIITEIHARLFFQTSFDCFNEHSKIDFVDLIDRTLGPSVLLFNDPLNGEIELLRSRCIEAVKNSSKPHSIGGILKNAWETGIINEREARENAVMYMLAQAPTMGSFWTVYRAVKNGKQSELALNRRELVKAIKEELRMHAPVSAMFTRVVLKDDELDNHAIEKGSTIIMSPVLIHTNSQQWTHPLEHDSNRWTSTIGDGKEIVDPKTDEKDANARPKPLVDGTHGARYVPFGGGGQACQGRWFASDEMLIVVEEILKFAKLEIVEDQGLLDKPLHDQIYFHVYNRPWNDVQIRIDEKA